MINYGIVYGLSDFGLADRLGIPREEAKEIIDTYLERFPAVRAFIEGTIASATENGHVTTLWGRRRQIPELKARNWQVRTLGERLAVNTVIQGTAADVMKLALVRVDAALRDSPVRPILTVHDELLFEGPRDEIEGVARAHPPRDVRRSGSTTRRSASTSASARPGWRRSSGGPRRRRPADGVHRRARRAAGADQLAARPRDRHVAGGVRSRSRSAPARWPASPRWRRAAWARSPRCAASPGTT